MKLPSLDLFLTTLALLHLHATLALSHPMEEELQPLQDLTITVIITTRRGRMETATDQVLQGQQILLQNWLKLMTTPKN
jgi:hypothetical protein